MGTSNAAHMIHRFYVDPLPDPPRIKRISDDFTSDCKALKPLTPPQATPLLELYENQAPVIAQFGW